MFASSPLAFEVCLILKIEAEEEEERDREGRGEEVVIIATRVSGP